jgi:hypothetical protein
MLAAGWTYLFTGREPPPAASPRPGAAYLTGMAALAVLLAHRSSFYGLYSFVGYYHSFEYLRGRWRWGGYRRHRGSA